MNSTTPDLRAGTARVAITPPLGTPMGGNARVDNYARGVLEEIFARALWIEPAGGAAVCIIALDLLCLWQSDTQNLRAAIAQETGCGQDNVLIACTHTHSGPDTAATILWGDEKQKRDAALMAPFWEELTLHVCEAAAMARESSQPATVRLGLATNAEIPHNRRLRMKSGETRMNWELPPANEVESPLGPVDPRLSVVEFWSRDEKLLGGIVHYSCHPAILAGANHLISGDFCGMAMSELEAQHGCGAFLFLQGASGNVNHIDYRLAQRGQGETDVRRAAAQLLTSVQEAMEDSRAVAATPLSVAMGELCFPLREIPQAEIDAAKEVLARYDGHDVSLADGIPPELSARKILRLAETARTGDYGGPFATMEDGQVLAPVQAIRLGDIVLATAPGEMFVEFGIHFRDTVERAHPEIKAALMVTMANAHINYVPTPEAFAQGGYEPGTGPSYLPHDAGDRITDELIKMAEELLNPR